MKRTHKTLRAAKAEAGRAATERNGRVFVERDPDTGLFVLSGDDGRGPLWSVRFWTVYPSTGKV